MRADRHAYTFTPQIGVQMLIHNKTETTHNQQCVLSIDL